jgi:hypothetical protein
MLKLYEEQQNGNLTPINQANDWSTQINYHTAMCLLIELEKYTFKPTLKDIEDIISSMSIIAPIVFREKD